MLNDLTFGVSQVDTLTRDCLEMKDNLDRVRTLADEQNQILEGIWREEQRKIAQDQKSFSDQVGLNSDCLLCKMPNAL